MYEKLGEDLIKQVHTSRAVERPLFVDAHSNVEARATIGRKPAVLQHPVFVQMTMSWSIFLIEIFIAHPTILEPV
jgi:hypothetical protein